MRVILKGNVAKMRAVMQEHDIKTGADLSLEKKISMGIPFVQSILILTTS